MSPLDDARVPGTMREPSPLSRRSIPLEKTRADFPAHVAPAPPAPTDTPTQFHILSFEGPDPYSRAGGIASRITGLSQTLADTGFETHLWFVGDPNLPGDEARGNLHLHRWCQWISLHHTNGVYDGEEGKLHDYSHSLPPHLLSQSLLPHLHRGGRAVVLAEEWHTVDAVYHLDHLLRAAGLRDRVVIQWNANNVFGFERIDWQKLSRACVLTTVSRYMKHKMWSLGIDPLAIPNGITPDAFVLPTSRDTAAFQRIAHGRTVLAKVARFDPDKRWIGALEIVARLRRAGHRPLLVARGGVEAHGHEVMQHAARLGLRVVDGHGHRTAARGLLDVLAEAGDADILNLRTFLDPEARRLLFNQAAAVLANSGHEPFGLVGLEAMAVEGLACTGSTGEEYASQGTNAIVLQTDDPDEFVGAWTSLRADEHELASLRRAGRRTSRQYTWPNIVRRHLLPRLRPAGSAQRSS